MTDSSVLIVGAGAVGLVTGYHLSLGGTAVTFYVRPGRRETFGDTQRLYCYDDGQIKDYRGYGLISTPAEVSQRGFDFVLLTLDAATCRSDEGAGLLRTLGDALRDTRAVMIFCGVGIGLRKYLAEATGLPTQRLLEGTLGNASHQSNARLPVHVPTDPAHLAQTSIAYRHFQKQVGFMLVPEPRDAARSFAALYDRCGISRCALVNAGVYRSYTNAFFCYTMTLELVGWPDTDGLKKRRLELHLCVAAMRDVLGLLQFGITGKLLRPLIGHRLLLKAVGKIERDVLPLDFAAFNRFHHGGKVLAQDVEVLRTCLREGERQGRAMKHLRELLRQFDQFRAGSSLQR